MKFTNNIAFLLVGAIAGQATAQLHGNTVNNRNLGATCDRGDPCTYDYYNDDTMTMQSHDAMMISARIHFRLHTDCKSHVHLSAHTCVAVCTAAAMVISSPLQFTDAATITRIAVAVTAADGACGIHIAGARALCVIVRFVTVAQFSRSVVRS